MGIYALIAFISYMQIAILCNREFSFLYVCVCVCLFIGELFIICYMRRIQYMHINEINVPGISSDLSKLYFFNSSPLNKNKFCFISLLLQCCIYIYTHMSCIFYNQVFFIQNFKMAKNKSLLIVCYYF